MGDERPPEGGFVLSARSCFRHVGARSRCLTRHRADAGPPGRHEYPGAVRIVSQGPSMSHARRPGDSGSGSNGRRGALQESASADPERSAARAGTAPRGQARGRRRPPPPQLSIRPYRLREPAAQVPRLRDARGAGHLRQSLAPDPPGTPGTRSSRLWSKLLLAPVAALFALLEFRSSVPTDWWDRQVPTPEVLYWHTTTNLEVDLVIEIGGRPLPSSISLRARVAH